MAKAFNQSSSDHAIKKKTKRSSKLTRGGLKEEDPEERAATLSMSDAASSADRADILPVDDFVCPRKWRVIFD
jgi:hypothetical protein